MKKIYATAALLLGLSISSFAFTNPHLKLKPELGDTKHGIAIVTGFGTPYGIGLEYAYRLTQKLDLTVGGGQSISGFRGGLGARFFLRDKAFSPFIAGNLIYSSGIDGLEFDANGTIATYDMPSRVAGFAKVGLKLGIGKHVALMGAVGYAQPLVNSQPVLVSGTDTDLHRTAMEVTNLGGVELSTALQIRF